MFSFFKKCFRTKWRRLILYIGTLILIGVIFFPSWAPPLLVWYLDRYHQIQVSDLSFHFPLKIKAKTFSLQKSSPSESITFIAKDLSVAISFTSLFSSQYHIESFYTKECWLTAFLYQPQVEGVTPKPPFVFPELPSIFIQELKNEKFLLSLNQVDSEGEMRTFRHQTAIHLKNIELAQLSELQLKITENGEIEPGDPSNKTQIDVLWKDFPIKPLLDFLGFPPEWSRHLKIIEGCQVKGQLFSKAPGSEKKEISLEIAFRGVRFAERSHNFLLDLRWELEGANQIQMIHSVLKTDRSKISVTHQTQDQYFLDFQLDPEEMNEPLEDFSLLVASPLRLISPIKATAIYDLKDEEVRDIKLNIEALEIYQHLFKDIQFTGRIQYEKNRAELFLNCAEIQGPFFQSQHIELSPQELRLENAGNRILGKNILFKAKQFQLNLPNPLFASSLEGNLEEILIEDLDKETPRISYQHGKIELQPGTLHLSEESLPTPSGTISISGTWEGANPKKHSIRFEDGFTTLHLLQEKTTVTVQEGDILLSPENLKKLQLNMTPLSLTDSWLDWGEKKAYLKISLETLQLPQNLSFGDIRFVAMFDFQESPSIEISSASIGKGLFTLNTTKKGEFLEVLLSSDLTQLASQFQLELPLTGHLQGLLQNIPFHFPLHLPQMQEMLLNPLTLTLQLQEGQWKNGPAFSSKAQISYYQQDALLHFDQLDYQDLSNEIHLSKTTQTPISQQLNFSKNSKIQLESLASLLKLEMGGSVHLDQFSLQVPTQIKEWLAPFQTEMAPETLFAALPTLDLNFKLGFQNFTFEKKPFPLKSIKIHLRSGKNSFACPEFFVEYTPWTFSGQIFPFQSLTEPLHFALQLFNQKERYASLKGTFQRPSETRFSIECRGDYQPYPVTLHQLSLQIEKEATTWNYRIPQWNIETNVLGTLLESQGSLSYANQQAQGLITVSTKNKYEGRISGLLHFPFQLDLAQHQLSFSEMRLTLQGSGPFPELPFPPNGLDLQENGSFLFHLEQGQVNVNPENFQGTFAVNKLTLQGKESRLFFQAFGLEPPIRNPKKEDYWTRPISEWKNFHLQLFPWKGSFSPNHFLTEVGQSELRLFHKLKQWANIWFSVGSIGIVDQSFAIPTPIEFFTKGEIPLSEAYPVFQPIFEHILMRDLSGTLRAEAGKITRDGIEVFPWLREVKSRFSYNLNGDRHQLMIDEVNGPAIYKCIWVKDLPFQFWVKNRPGTMLQGKKFTYGIERKARGKRRVSHNIEPEEALLPPLFIHLENLNLQLKEITMEGVDVENLTGQWAGGWFQFTSASFFWKPLLLRVGGILQQVSLKHFHRQTQFFSGILDGIVDGQFQLHIDFSAPDSNSKEKTIQELWTLIDLDKTSLQVYTTTPGEVRIDSLLEVPEGLNFTQQVGVNQLNNFRYKQVSAKIQRGGKEIHVTVNKDNLSFEGTIPTMAFVQIANGTESLEVASVYWNWQKITDLEGKFFVTFNNKEEEKEASAFLYRLFWGSPRSGSNIGKNLLELIPDNKELQHKFMMLLDTITPFQQE